jgi:hypothetical protein
VGESDLEAGIVMRRLTPGLTGAGSYPRPRANRLERLSLANQITTMIFIPSLTAGVFHYEELRATESAATGRWVLGGCSDPKRISEA